jgi:phosphoglucomutase
MDTHALSEPALASAIEVFAANEVDTMIQTDLGYTPTPAISYAILTYNQGRSSGWADGVIITPSHNPPEHGGIKYNPPSGGPADTEITLWIQDHANEILKDDSHLIKRIPFKRALKSDFIHWHDYIQPYATDLKNVLDMDIIAESGLKIGVDPMGGAAVHFWEPIAEMYDLNLQVVNKKIDLTFSFMTLDWDGNIRMDCSSAYAMTNLIRLKDHYDIAFGNDPDADRHGIVTPGGGLMDPNHYLAVAVWYLLQNRPQWPVTTAVGKTLVSSSIIDRIAKDLKKKLVEVPVGFKWFVNGLLNAEMGFAGEESAGAAFLRQNGAVWTTDKDGIILTLLAAEMTAAKGKDPGEIYQDIEQQYGTPHYKRLEAPANLKQKKLLKNLSKDQIHSDELAGDPIIDLFTHAPGNNAPIGGLKVTTKNGWFAARPSGTEDIYKIYAESFKDTDHLDQILDQAKQLISKVFKQAGL